MNAQLGMIDESGTNRARALIQALLHNSKANCANDETSQITPTTIITRRLDPACSLRIAVNRLANPDLWAEIPTATAPRVPRIRPG
jgi:hypothetical protein